MTLVSRGTKRLSKRDLQRNTSDARKTAREACQAVVNAKTDIEELDAIQRLSRLLPRT